MTRELGPRRRIADALRTRDGERDVGAASRPSDERAEVLLAGGDDRSLLATARSLRRRGVSYAAIGLSPASAMGISRYVRSHIAGVGPDARADPAAYVEFLLEVVRARRVGLVLPLTDRTLATCDRFRDVIESKAVLAAPPAHAVRNVLDKKANLETVRGLGIPCPAQFELERMEQLPELVDTLGFPMVLKQPGPALSGGRRRLDLDWVVVRDEDALRRELEMHSQRGVFPIVQEVVDGVSWKLCCFAVRGEAVAIQAWRNVRTFRGLSVLREVVPLTPQLRDYTERLLRELDWDGVAHVEFFVREHDGDGWYIETNGRLWAHIESSVASGWDFPFWIYEYFLHGRPPRPPPPEHAIGTRARWHFGDLQALVELLLGGERRGWRGHTRAGAALDYLAGFSPNVHPDVFRWDDPLPELVEHARGARGASRQLLRRSQALRRIYHFVRRRPRPGAGG